MQAFACMIGAVPEDLTLVFKALADPDAAAAARPAAGAQRPDAGRAVRLAGHGPPVGVPAPRRPRGGEPGQHRPARPGEAALPQPRSAARDAGAVDLQVRDPPAARAQRRPALRRGARHDHPAHLRLRHLHPGQRRAGVARPDRRRPDRPLLGTPQRVGLAAGLDLGARAHRRLRDRRRHRHGARGPAARAARLTFPGSDEQREARRRW